MTSLSSASVLMIDRSKEQTARLARNLWLTFTHLVGRNLLIMVTVTVTFSLALPLVNLTFQQNTDSFVGQAFAVFPGGREANIDDIQSVSEMPHLYLTTRNIFCVCIYAPSGFDFEDPILFTAQP